MKLLLIEDDSVLVEALLVALKSEILFLSILGQPYFISINAKLGAV